MVFGDDFGFWEVLHPRTAPLPPGKEEPFPESEQEEEALRGPLEERGDLWRGRNNPRLPP